MPPRGRLAEPAIRYEYCTDDDESYYEELPTASRPVKRSSSRLRVEFDDSHRQPSPVRRVKRQSVHHHHSYAAPLSATDPADNIIIENHLNLPPQPRPRASSTGAAPHPNLIYVQGPPREPSRERVKHYHHHKHYDSEESSDDGGSYKSSHRRRRRSSHRDEGQLPAEVLRKLAKLELIEQQNESLSPATAEKLARLKMLEEQRKREEYSPATAEKLARLKALEEKKNRDEEEAALRARIEDRERKEKLREEQLLLRYQERQRQEEDDQRRILAEAEAKRTRKEVEAKAEADRLLARQKEKEAKEKAERLRIIAEEKARSDKERKEAEEERKRILLEEELRRKKEKEEAEVLRKRILAEEVERKKKEKEKAEKEEEEFQQKVKEKFMRAGYSPDYIEDILDEKKKSSSLARVGSKSRRRENQLALEVSRPTYIRVQVRHLSEDTLDYYGLPWEYDENDRRYILIKEYIGHDFQQELFEHTRKLRVKKQKLLITDGYVKDTVTTLKPKDVYKDSRSDEMFVVRRKSVSKSPSRRSWMFT
ncbi:hypothetical protein LTR64_002372 [Lithohypha guttulata]|uniref:Uncharacterized protein n=1 Tax=Lithohypha guttulata TaxID=1690604 RepID=A0AAN7Y9K0_9EURO|nr:hypothetical protein LTR51_001403 [Lithohypha guttulata]KAK5083448.1 hypothetical protein LTR05_005950 [Lithohypha guttulata]